MNVEEGARLTLVISGVGEYPDALADAVFEATDGDCGVGSVDHVLYVDIPQGADGGWMLAPRVFAAIREVVPAAELLRVEMTDGPTAAERARQPLEATRAATAA